MNDVCVALKQGNGVMFVFFNKDQIKNLKEGSIVVNGFSFRIHRASGISKAQEVHKYARYLFENLNWSGWEKIDNNGKFIISAQTSSRVVVLNWECGEYVAVYEKTK